MSKEKTITFAIGDTPLWFAEAVAEQLTKFVGKKVEVGGYIGRKIFKVHGTPEDAEVCRAWLRPGNHTFYFSLADVYDDEMRQNIGTYKDSWDHEWNDYVIYKQISDEEYIVYDNAMRDKYNSTVHDTYIGLKNEYTDKGCSIVFCDTVERAGMTENGRPLLKMKVKGGMFGYDLLRNFEKKNGIGLLSS